MNKAIVVITVLALHGCASSRMEDPVVIDDLSPVGFWATIGNNLGAEYEGVNTLSATASRRIAIVKQIPGKEIGEKTKICSEPPPDVAEAFASALSNAIAAKGKEPKSGIEAEISNNYLRAAATQVTPLLYRSQALQLYREAASGLCIDQMNGQFNKTADQKEVTLKTIRYDDKGQTQVSEDEMKINTNDYNHMKYLYFVKALEILQIEIPKIAEAQKAYFETSKTSIPLPIVEAIISAINAVGTNKANSLTPFCSDGSKPNKTDEGKYTCSDGKPVQGG